jgi:AcrR family transcriptional regulator
VAELLKELAEVVQFEATKERSNDAPAAKGVSPVARIPAAFRQSRAAEREHRSNEARQKMLERAILVVETHGEAAVRVRDLKEHCDVTTPMIYEAFGSRDGVIVAAQAERYRQAIRSDMAMFLETLPTVTTRAEFRKLYLETTRCALEERAPQRRTRASVIGSSFGRPALAAEIRKLDNDLLELRSRMLAYAQEQGWIDADVDVRAVTAWQMGQQFSRILVDLDHDSTGMLEAWDTIAIEAVDRMLWRDPTN